MRFKVGDKVRVKKDLVVGRNYSNCLFNNYMAEYRNKVATIIEVFNIRGYYNCYKVDIDHNCYWWADEMLEPEENFIKYEQKHIPIIYQIYDYLKSNCVGYDHRLKSDVIMNVFDINDNKTLRKYIEEIRDSDTLQKIVCSEAGSNGGYWIATNDEEVYTTLQHFYKRSIKMLRTYSKLKRKHSLNNQYKLKLSKYEKELYQSIMEKEK